MLNICRCLQDLKKIFLVKPMEKLPSSLVLREGSDLVPPVLHYGWVIDENILIDFARRRRITCRLKTTWFSDDSDGEEEEEDDAKRYSSANPNLSFVMAHALVAKAKDLDLTNVPDISLVIDPSSKDRTAWVVSLITNHTLKTSFIDRPDIKKLADDLNLAGNPMWYLDYCHSRWE